jgi:hypothetical protein
MGVVRDRGSGDFRVIFAGSVVAGAPTPDARTICTTGAAARTAETRIIVHLVRMPQF